MDTHLRQSIRSRLVSGELFPVDGHAVGRRATGKLCVICGMSIAEGEFEHEVVGLSRIVLAHWDCYSIWRQESEVMLKAIRRSDIPASC